MSYRSATMGYLALLMMMTIAMIAPSSVIYAQAEQPLDPVEAAIAAAAQHELCGKRSPEEIAAGRARAAELLGTSSNATSVSQVSQPAQGNQVLLPMVMLGRLTAADTFFHSFAGPNENFTTESASGWFNIVHMRNRETWDAFAPMQAEHNANCDGPTTTRTISKLEDALYVCRQHLMTALNGGPLAGSDLDNYGVAYFGPNQLLDFSEETAVVSWDMSTMRHSGRDWVDLWIMPFDDNQILPLQDWLPDLNGEPRRGVLIEMDFVNNRFKGFVINDHNTREITTNTYTTYDEFLEPSSVVRDRFELRISKTRIKFGMPDYDVWWIDEPISNLGWDQAVVQFGHHSYMPQKDCQFAPNSPCIPGTWHWDNFSLSPALPLTTITGDKQTLGSEEGGTLQLDRAVPQNAYLRFAGTYTNLRVSFDGGKTWQNAQRQASEELNEGHFQSYWMPIPAGTTEVRFRGTGNDLTGGRWLVRSPTVWVDPNP